ncbi:MAG TPA: NAD(P)H-dependent oxidoreductase [Clostridia bacterium]|nr:NAD(P)H-dependent oxidoreductase [Clostridia bacterium]
MKITLINGNLRHGSTWHCADAIVQELAKLDKNKENEVVEFFLPRDMPQFCRGCFSCIYNGEGTCPDAESIRPIVRAIEAADLVVLASPVYAFDVSGQMKTLLDHLCYMWMSHRPNPAVFRKIGLTVATAAGMGLGHTTKTMKDSLSYWGMKKVFTFAQPVAAMKWSDVSEKTQAKIRGQAKALARRIARAVARAGKRPNPPLRSVFFSMMAGMQRGNDWNPTDRTHWEAQGWLAGKRPF